MKFIKNLWSLMDDKYFGGCLVLYVEKAVFNTISYDVII